MSARFDVVIIGAGIVGAACARECALAGLRTAIVEEALPASGATAKGMGHVVAMDDSPAQLALTKYSRAVWEEQAPGFAAAGVEYRTPGTIWVAADDDEMAEVAARQTKYAAADVAAEVLSAGRLAELEPNLRAGLAGALLVPGDGVTHPPAVAAYYLAEARRLGVLLLQARVVAAADGVVTLAEGTRLQADKIVLAVGTDCALLPALPIRKRKGHLVITEARPGFLSHQLVELGYLKSAHSVEEDSVVFNVQPRPDGRILIGASRQSSNEDPAADAPIVAGLLARAARYMPGLASVASDHVRVGFRAATPDKLPMIGPARGLSEDETLWLAAGFEGLGITCAPGAARLLVDAMLGRDSGIDHGAYLAARFGGG